MKSTNFIVLATVVIAATLNHFGVQGFPNPQLNIKVGSRNELNLDPFGGFFGRETSESPNSPHGFNLDPLGIFSGRPTSEKPNSPHGFNLDPLGIFSGRPTSEKPNSPHGFNLDPLGIFSGRPTSEKPNSPHGFNLDPLGIFSDRPTSESPISPNDPSHTITPTVRPTFPTPLPTVIPIRPTQSPVVNPTPVPASTQLDPVLCAHNCMVRTEYNPVCGSNGIIYNNAGLLACTRNCGINVSQLHTGRCSEPSPPVTPKPPTPAPVTELPDAAQCAQNCMLTQEYNPVCGSDGVTYRNVGLLICTSNCGINVTQRSSGRCFIQEDFSIDPRTGSN